MIAPNRVLFEIQNGPLSFKFLPSGDIYQIHQEDMMVNQWLANVIDGSMNNLYLRVFEATGIRVIPLLGIQSNSRVRHSDTQVVWEGEAGDLSYTVVFTLTDQGIWFWDVRVNGTDANVDLIYGQDVGIAHRGAIRTNEAYLSQYIDHAVFEDDSKGYIVCSRQNQPQQGGVFPYLQQGSITKAKGYSTDGFQFFGLSYKETNQPEILSQASLKNEVYQYEFAYTALQSERVSLDGSARFVFYGLYKKDHAAAVTALEYQDEVQAAWSSVLERSVTADRNVPQLTRNPIFGEPLKTGSISAQELEQYYPARHNEEYQEDTLLAFFTAGQEHVVLKEKELLVERPHGHILMTGNNVQLDTPVLTTTSYMYGIFNSQLVIGNTSFNKMLTNARSALNMMKTSGQRIYVERDGKYQLLTMPSWFEMGFNYARWFYKTEDDVIVITNYSALDTPEVMLHVHSEKGRGYRWLVTNQVTMNNNEYEVDYHMEHEGSKVSFTADAKAESASVYPNLRYSFHLEGASFQVTDEKKFGPNMDSQAASLAVFELNESSDWVMTMQGLLDGEDLPVVTHSAEEEISKYREFYRSVMNGFHLSQEAGETEDLQKVNALAWWYTHNMLVHYSVPHGLEQYGGAAWGTRDVCQGPTEYFMATHKYEEVRNILTTLYSHQYEDDGNWPQWFMFDKYSRIQQEESHGDIIVWPLKVLGDYLFATQDFDVLKVELPYTVRHTFEFTDHKATLLDHAKKEIEYIKNNFLHDTYLSSYGDGDWDDTLQPANAQLKKYMISSWTVALTYQVMNRLSSILSTEEAQLSSELHELAEGIKRDFQTYMLDTGVIPGFVYMEEQGQAELMLHPTDTKTGIQYRLLPMTRSIISELLTPEQAASHYDLIKEHMYCPDGVRLMNHPAHYAGGVSTNFKRAEQAANFGREVGLQYVHAHIRYVESMAKFGKSNEVWKGLLMINPVGIQRVVPNAELRQSNAYFSSSDGKFNTRYEAQEHFDELRQGTVQVKGGWRIYSSGPGIYMNQLISNALGLRQEGGDLILDPVLPTGLNGLKFDFRVNERMVQVVYHLTGGPVERILINGQEVATEVEDNRYRTGGLRVKQQDFDKLAIEGTNRIEVFM
ncbi:cellobiose phosphorylase [Paenibacillus selenitireducens]|uniref:Cellobiose phosphorylase n=1 Tax=Paenibacillus selenitireducens TaxID=1324314 RepID=A0A1T2XHS7_9BACL|nr:cellobiose phosphorylase [Paenibacillus selenitireducens]OPA79420.1 cellobiose phosphorylase [Paenibacillus selenitireducens]